MSWWGSLEVKYVFLIFLVGKFLLLLVEVSLQMFFLGDFSSDFFVEKCLLRFFGRDFSSVFLAENVSSEFPW